MIDIVEVCDSDIERCEIGNNGVGAIIEDHDLMAHALKFRANGAAEVVMIVDYQYFAPHYLHNSRVGGKLLTELYVNIYALVANNITFSHHLGKRNFDNYLDNQVDKNNSEKTEEYYRLADISSYPWDKRLLIRAISRSAHWAIGLIGKTVSFETEGIEHLEKLQSEGRQPIYALWHDRIFLGTYYLRKRRIVAMVSQSFDGEYIARVIQLQGNGAVRGSSTRGGVKGLVEMIRIAKGGVPMCFIVDGPKGPRYEAKEGAVLLAKKAGIPILPFSVELKDHYEMNSWDKLQVPRPFTKAKVFMAEPIYVSNADTVEEKRLELQNALESLRDKGNAWRSGGK